jgi:hypothetical protein
MKKKLITFAWSELRPYLPYVIGAIIVVCVYVFKDVQLKDEVYRSEGRVETLMEMVEDHADINLELLEEVEQLKKDAEIADAERDSLSALVDSFEPEIIRTIEYITDGSNDEEKIDSAKHQLVTGIEIMSLERKGLIEAVESRDEIIAIQGRQINNLNSQVGLLVESNDELFATNKQLKKQIRREVRKRRLITIVSVAAVVATIVTR